MIYREAIYRLGATKIRIWIMYDFKEYIPIKL